MKKLEMDDAQAMTLQAAIFFAIQKMQFSCPEELERLRVLHVRMFSILETRG